MLLIFYLSDEVVNDMSRLAAMIISICDLAGDVVNDYAYNSISPWWQYVRELLLECHKSLGLLVAIVCKTVASNLRKEFKEVNLINILILLSVTLVVYL